MGSCLVSAKSRSMKNPLNKSSQNILLFSFFWALYIFQSKRAFIAGAQIISFQIQTGLSALAALSFVMLPNVFREMRVLLRERPKLFWQLALGNGLHNGVGGTLYIIGVSLTEAINAGFLVKFSVVGTTFLAWIFLGEKMSWRKILSLTLMVGGMYLLTTRGEHLYPKTGDLFILSACLAWSFGNILLRHGLRNDSVSTSLVSYLKPLVGLPIFIFLVAFLPQNKFLVREEFTFEHFGYAILAGILLALAWVYLNHSLKGATASYVTMLSTATPVFVSILAIVFLNERFLFIQGIGGTLIVLAGILIYFSDMRYR